MRGWRRLIRWPLGVVLTWALAGCSTVQIAPEPRLPRALIDPVPVEAGLVLTAEQTNYTHTETRAGVEWIVNLGSGHQVWAREVFGSLFQALRSFTSLSEARAATPPVIMEPVIEQFSFATARETAGEYVAVTVRYRVNVFNPQGELHDVLALTGYGTSSADGLGAGAPIEQATRAAMRDAAARLLTQFRGLPLAEDLIAKRPLQALGDGSSVVARMDALPIRVSRRTDPNWRPAATPTR